MENENLIERIGETQLAWERLTPLVIKWNFILTFRKVCGMMYRTASSHRKEPLRWIRMSTRNHFYEN